MESGKRSWNCKCKDSGTNQFVSKRQQTEDSIDDLVKVLRENMSLNILCLSYSCGHE